MGESERGQGEEGEGGEKERYENIDKTRNRPFQLC